MKQNSSFVVSLKNILFRAFPVLGVLFALLVQNVIADSPLHPAATHGYYNSLLLILLVVAFLAFVLSFFLKNFAKTLTHKGPFLFGAGVLVSVLNLITAKLKSKETSGDRKGRSDTSRQHHKAYKSLQPYSAAVRQDTYRRT